MDGFGYNEPPVLDQGHSFADMAETFGLDPNASASSILGTGFAPAALATPPPFLGSPPAAASPADAEPVLDFMARDPATASADGSVAAAAAAAAAAITPPAPVVASAPSPSAASAAAAAAAQASMQDFQPAARVPAGRRSVPSPPNTQIAAAAAVGVGPSVSISPSAFPAAANLFPSAPAPASRRAVVAPNAARPARPSPAPASSPPAPAPAPAPAPHPAVEAARRRLRPAADALIARCWKGAYSAPAFVSAARMSLRAEPSPSALPAKVEATAAAAAFSLQAGKPDAPSGAGKKRLREPDGSSPGAKRLRPSGPAFGGWTLSAGAEAALLDALVARVTCGELSSARVLGYVRYALVSGLVRARAALGALVKAGAAAGERTQVSLAELAGELLPHYHFEGKADALTAECADYLGAVALVLRVAKETAGAVPVAARLLGSARVICLARAASRRTPAHWVAVEAAISKLVGADGPPSLANGLRKLSGGLAAGGSNFAAVAAAAGKAELPDASGTLTAAVPFALGVLRQIFGNRVGTALQEIWAKGPSPRGDLPLLLDLARTASANPPLLLRDVVRACEATVRFLAERSAHAEWAGAWSAAWGGRKRLTKLLTDALPQVRSELRSEASSMLVALAVAGATAMALGPALRLDEAGGRAADAADAARREAADSEIAEAVGDFAGFAVGTMEAGAVAEEMPPWRSLGLWTLLFASRCGALLSAAGCEHVRAARVLRAWAGAPTGTPGAHNGSAHKSAPAARPTAAMVAAQAAEVIAVFATPAAWAIVDAADCGGDDATLWALCEDYES